MSTAEERGEVRMVRTQAPGDGQAIIALSGEFDLLVTEELRALLEVALAEHPRLLVLDAAEVSFVDSTILRELLLAHTAARSAGGRLVIAAPRAGFIRLLELTGAGGLIEVADSLADALASRD